MPSCVCRYVVCRLIQNITQLNSTCVNFIYALEKSMAFTTQIFMKLTNAHEHYMQILYTEFGPKQPVAW